jgi:hypothetical protein
MATDVTGQPELAGGADCDQLGARVGMATAVAGLLALAGGVSTPPRSGVFCTNACITHLFTDGAAVTPRDYLWMYPALLLVILLVLMALCIHRGAPRPVRVLSGTAVLLSLLAACAIVIDYAVQLIVLQTSLVQGDSQGLTLLSMDNPHGVFIALEDIGYLLVGVAFLFAGRALPRTSGLQRSLSWLLTAGGTLDLGALVLLSLWYRSDLDYRFEVSAIVITWLVLTVAGILANRMFAQRLRTGLPEPTIALG